MPEPRRFSTNQRAALLLHADARCTQCGDPLPEGWHGDHLMAFAAGGETDVVNGAAKCPRCNAIRGARDATGGRVRPLRAWQRGALDLYEASMPRDFLVVATPGAGKTWLGGTVAGRHLRAGRAELVVVVVPTERLKGQWADDIAGCGVQLAPDWTNADGVMPGGFDGVVVTYAQVAALPDLMRRHVSSRVAVCLFDEIHHCGDSRSWGDALRHAFEPARWRVALSGTPFRSDNNAIPFVRYVDGAGTADVTYDYGEAIAEGVCRPVYFPRRGGRMEWATSSGEVLEATFEDELDEHLANQRLRTALTLEGNWLASVLDEAHLELVELRSAAPDAGGLVLAADQAHARGIAELLRVRHAVEPVLVTSDDPEANDRIEVFARGTAPWIVSVRMVSEGVDIPRLRVGVYAAPVTSELFFRQAVGRLVRMLDAESGETASCYIPDDPRLRSYAATIRAQRDHVLDEEADALLNESEPGIGEGTRNVCGFQPIASEATDAGGIYEGTQLSPAELARAAELKVRTPQTSLLPTPAVAMLLRLVSGEGEGDVPTPTAVPSPAHRRRRDLRAVNQRVVGRIAYAHGLDHRAVNSALNAAVGIDGVASASIENLNARLRLAQGWLVSGREPSE